MPRLGSRRDNRSSVRRIVAATDRSETASRAVEWAAEMAERYEAELLLVQVLAPEGESGDSARAREESVASDARVALAQLAQELAGDRGNAQVLTDSDPSAAIVELAQAEEADVIVVGNVAMRGRKEFLLANVPNRISHNAACTVVIVNTEDREPRGLGRVLRRS